MILPTAIKVIWCPVRITLACQKVSTKAYKPRCVHFTPTRCGSCYCVTLSVSSIAGGKITLVALECPRVKTSTSNLILNKVAKQYLVEKNGKDWINKAKYTTKKLATFYYRPVQSWNCPGYEYCRVIEVMSSILGLCEESSCIYTHLFLVPWL